MSSEVLVKKFRARNFSRTPLIHAQVQGFVRHFGQADQRPQQRFLRNFEIEQQPRQEQRRTADAEFLCDDSVFSGRSGKLDTFPDRRETFEEKRLFLRKFFRAVEKGVDLGEIIGMGEVVENFRCKGVKEAVKFRLRALLPGEVLPDYELFRQTERPASEHCREGRTPVGRGEPTNPAQQRERTRIGGGKPF